MKSYYAILFLIFLSACDPFDTQIDENQVYTYQANNLSTPSSTSQLIVANWNIKFGGGRVNFFFDCHEKKSIMKKEKVEQNLALIIDKINQVNPDIIFLQEVDILSKRSAYVDQVQWILDHTQLNYGVYASQWQADYVPSDGVGRVNSGNVILSKYPLSETTRIALPLIESQSKLTQYFYLRRNILKTKVSIDEKEIFLLNTHLTAYGEDNIKQDQLTILEENIEMLHQEGKSFIAGGDLNTIPPHSIKKSDFPDVVCEHTEDDDYTGEEESLTNFYANYASAIPLEKYKNDNSPYFTHSIASDQFWNRKIDYLFTNKNFVENSEITHQEEKSGGMEMMSRSDHAMLSVKFEF